MVTAAEARAWVSLPLAGLAARSREQGTPLGQVRHGRSFLLVVGAVAWPGVVFPGGKVVVDVGDYGVCVLDGGVEELLAMNPGGRIEWADQQLTAEVLDLAEQKIRKACPCVMGECFCNAADLIKEMHR